ncbi:MAG TPA: EVE domain-containing protein [Candidatus Limnocylindria bacterium]|nr:EVE domain-containing protein [Candidatus Limnocylindria bacterium]
MTVKLPFEITFSFIPAADPGSAGSIRVYLTQPSARGSDQNGPADSQNTWIFQASPQLSDVKGAMRSVQQPVCLVQQFGKAIKPGDRVYLWECGPRGGIIGLAEVAEAPRIQPEPAEQLPFIRETEKFAGDQLRVKLRMLKRIEPVISRKYLLSRPELAGLSILRCARGTNFRVTHEQAAALQKVVEGFQSFPNENGSGEKRVVFAQG